MNNSQFLRKHAKCCKHIITLKTNIMCNFVAYTMVEFLGIGLELFKTYFFSISNLPLINENKHSDVDPNVLNLKW